MTDIEREYRNAIVQLLLLGYDADADRLRDELNCYRRTNR